MAGVRRTLGDVSSAQARAAKAGAMQVTRVLDEPAKADTYRMVDFVKAVAMRDDRGQEVRVQRIRLGAPVDRESPMRIKSIVLNGAWFDIMTVKPMADADNVVHYYRVHVTNTVSAER